MAEAATTEGTPATVQQPGGNAQEQRQRHELPGDNETATDILSDRFHRLHLAIDAASDGESEPEADPKMATELLAQGCLQIMSKPRPISQKQSVW